MFAWNSPYTLAVLIGIIAVSIFYFDQKQKKLDPSKMEYIKIFTLVTGSIIAFNHLVDNSLSIQIIEKTPVLGGSIYNNLKIKEGPPDF
jgi:uncharacterized membrane protein